MDNRILLYFIRERMCFMFPTLHILCSNCLFMLLSNKKYCCACEYVLLPVLLQQEWKPLFIYWSVKLYYHVYVKYWSNLNTSRPSLCLICMHFPISNANSYFSSDDFAIVVSEVILFSSGHHRSEHVRDNNTLGKEIRTKILHPLRLNGSSSSSVCELIAFLMHLTGISYLLFHILMDYVSM